RLQHVHRLVGVAGLRAAVSGPPHAEGGRVVVRRLLRVADREHHGVHADDGKAGGIEGVGGPVLCWRRHAASMRTIFQSAQSTEFLLGKLSSKAERAMISLYTMTTVSSARVDHLDAALIELLAAEPRVGVL